MPLHIIRQDITRMKVEAIVAAGSAKEGTPAPTGGVNGRIHQKAGSGLLAALRSLGGIRTAGATLTPGYDLPCRYVIHTAGPMWRGGSYGEATLLRACYEEALKLAARQQFESIAFPLISTGKYGYPKAEALEIATAAIRDFLRDHDMTVYLVVYDKEAFRVSGEHFSGVEQFIDEHYVQRHYVGRSRSEDDWADMLPRPSAPSCCAQEMPQTDAFAMPPDDDTPPELLRRLHQLDEGFTQMLLRLIDERGMKDSECYRRANVDRKHFSKIRNTPGYTPKKPTVVAFCIALELDLRQSRELLSRAGYALTRASMFDVIVEYFISRGEKDVHTINQVLFAYDQPLLGAGG